METFNLHDPLGRNCHIIAIPFTGVGLRGGYRGDVWFKHRISIFKNHTLKSLANQTNKDFVIWCWFRKEEEHNPLVMDIAYAIQAIGLPFVFTFHGLMYHDDKFSNYNLKTKVRNFLMMVRDCWAYKEFKSLREIWHFTWENKNQTLLKRLTSGLHIVAKSIGSDFEWVYLTRIDSDDMFHKNAVELIQDQTPDSRKALVFDKGYIYNVETGQLASWEPPTNPPFHTIIFPGNIFFDSQAHLEYYKNFKSHEDIPRVFNCTTLDMNKFCVTAHGRQISTAYNSPVTKKIYHKIKYGSAEPFKGQEIEPRGYLYSVSGRNISTRWRNRTTQQINPMIGKEYQDNQIKQGILKDFGIV